MSPRDEWVTLNGLSFHYRDWGGSGQPVVLLHGLASTCHIWDFVAPMLAQHFAVVAVDQRGHGESAKPGHGYDFATVSNDLLAFLKAREISKPVIAGHSWGADVALEFAVSNPGEARGICFVDGGMIEPSARQQSLEQARKEMAPPIFDNVTRNEFLERVRSRQNGIFSSPEAAEIVLANFDTLTDGTIRAHLSRDNHLRIIDALWDHHPPVLYPQVECPVLIMPARQQDDPATFQRRDRRAKSLARAAELLPVSKTVFLENSVHDVPVQRPGLVARVIKEHIDAGFFTPVKK
ncbi:MAG: hypothetical protein BZY80_04270 [SAR202 cluster bacterium Io17-Chloro-G2]|nr:MAG: hypothetical protein BZY80_04270 [SAR202 cluster bacterium Io17-Chloro-G2]